MKGVAEDEMVGWHHPLSGHYFEKTLRDSEGQGSLACCIQQGCKESDMTERLNNNLWVWEPRDALYKVLLVVNISAASISCFAG